MKQHNSTNNLKKNGAPRAFKEPTLKANCLCFLNNKQSGTCPSCNYLISSGIPEKDLINCENCNCSCAIRFDPHRYQQYVLENDAKISMHNQLEREKNSTTTFFNKFSFELDRTIQDHINSSDKVK